MSLFGFITSETPKFELLSSTSVYEIRKYAPQITASVAYTSDHAAFGSGTSGAFRKLASFIFGSNTATNGKSEAVAMTSPVVISQAESSVVMSFILPSKFTHIDQIPVPKDENVTFSQVGERTVAVIKFSGWASKELFQRKQDELRAACKKDDVLLDDNLSNAQNAGYNPPWTLPFLRRNEVFIPLA